LIFPEQKADQAFLHKAINTNGLLDKVVIDKSGANAQALHNMNVKL
jgi:transposase-like protein